MKKNVGDSLESLLGMDNDSEDNEDAKVITCPAPLTTIKIKAIALEKMFILAEEVFRVLQQALEAYCLCVGNNGIIEDILVPRQEVSFASVTIEPAHIMEISEIIRARKLNILGWSHSHANFNVFFSGVDDRNQTTLLAETSNYLVLQNVKIKYVYGMTVNIHHHYFGVVSTQYACGRVEHYKAQFEIIDELPADWDADAFRSQMYDEVTDKVTTRNAGWWHHKSNKQDKEEKRVERTLDKNINMDPEKERIREILKPTIENGQIIDLARPQSQSSEIRNPTPNPDMQGITHPFDNISQDTPKSAEPTKPPEPSASPDSAKPMETSPIAEPTKPAEPSALPDSAKPMETSPIAEPTKPAEPSALPNSAKPMETSPIAEPTKPAEPSASPDSVKTKETSPIAEPAKMVEPSTIAEPVKTIGQVSTAEPSKPIELSAAASPVNPNFIIPPEFTMAQPEGESVPMSLPLVEEFLIAQDLAKYNPKELLSLFVQFLHQKNMIVNKVENQANQKKEEKEAIKPKEEPKQ